MHTNELMVSVTIASLPPRRDAECDVTVMGCMAVHYRGCLKDKPVRYMSYKIAYRFEQGRSMTLPSMLASMNLAPNQ